MGTAESIAHVSTDGVRVHPLVEHLNDVAANAKTSAAHFDSGEWGWLAGLWHDLGKFSQAFQQMIRSKSGLDANIEAPGKVIHSTAGALLAHKRFGDKLGLPLAFVIAGHHGGLKDYHDCLQPRLETEKHLLAEALAAEVPASITAATPPKPPAFLGPAKNQDQAKRSYEFWVRMLYSCLVDADFLDTEEFFKGKPRASALPLDAGLLARFDAYMAEKAAQVHAAGLQDTKVNLARARILQACRDRAQLPQGVFSLTAPTGGGKTLAALAFALKHAIKYQLRRVIVVIPFTSIIEQSVKQYRDVFGSEAVIEHHSNLDPINETPANRIACENWDAPIIVTTSVQFLESLLANRSSRCRKLHNIVRSVVVFDEVQTLPPGHLAPIIDVLKELVRNYHVSLVLSTATQPALHQWSLDMRAQFPGFEQVTPILPDAEKVFADLRRFDVVWPESLNEAKTYETLAAEIQAEPRSVLAIVHRRDDARTLARLIPGARHLSALMCPAHRSKVIEEIKAALRPSGQNIVKVVSTQLVEAGVDFDFPVVYRALGGLDALAQAGGRCNREGLLDGRGELRLFLAPTSPPKGTPRLALQVARTELAANPALDLANPHLFERYFQKLYGNNLPHDVHGIQADRAAWKFETVASNFKLIEDDGSVPLVVPYGDAPARLNDLRNLGPSRDRLRAIQPFIVNVYPGQIQALESANALERLGEVLFALKQIHSGHYDENFGMTTDGP